jgi:signal transduction histidine kinase
MELQDLRASLRSDRPPVELADFPKTYQRTRIVVNGVVAVAIAANAARFNAPEVVVPAIVGLALVILLHALLLSGWGLVAKVSFDTAIYITMAVLADSPEVVLLVAATQAFIVFFHVRPRTALLLMGSYMAAGLAGAVAAILLEMQHRSTGDTLYLVTAVTMMATIPIGWILSQVGAQMHRQREREESLYAETKQLLSDKDRFVASVSHELRTPLTAVVGLAHTLADDQTPISESERTEFIRMVVEQSEDVAAIVDDLLVAARADSGHLALVVGEVDLCAELASVVPENVPIETDLESLVAVGDPIRVRQILRNLVSNAIRYGGSHKRVRLSRRGVLGIVQVQDTGDPIPAHQVETIFTAYGRAHDRPGRTDSVGLGLTVSRQLARMMGGDVAYSHDGRWAAFEFSLPLSVTAVAQAIVAAPEEARAAHQVDLA